MDTNTENKISEWLTGNYDEATKKEIKQLQETDASELEDAFYKDLEFGRLDGWSLGLTVCIFDWHCASVNGERGTSWSFVVRVALGESPGFPTRCRNIRRSAPSRSIGSA